MVGALNKADTTPVIMPPKQIQTQSELDAMYKAQLTRMPKVVNQNLATVDMKSDFQLQWGVNILEGKPLPANVKSVLTK